MSDAASRINSGAGRGGITVVPVYSTMPPPRSSYSLVIDFGSVPVAPNQGHADDDARRERKRSFHGVGLPLFETRRN